MHFIRKPKKNNTIFLSILTVKPLSVYGLPFITWNSHKEVSLEYIGSVTKEFAFVYPQPQEKIVLHIISEV